MPKTIHGHAADGWSPTYRSWMSMKDRCNNPHNVRYYRYGAIGVRVCKRWTEFENFLADMGVRPRGTTLGRIGDTGNYEPGNCEWQTPNEQGKKGEANKNAKLTEEQVHCIRSLYKPRAKRGCSATNMAADLGIHPGSIDGIVRRITWRHI